MLNNIASILEYKKNKENLKSISESQLMLPSKWKLFVAKLIGAFIFKWLIYIIAFVITGSFLVIIISLILITLRIYLMFHSLIEIQESKTDLYVLVAETVFVGVFMLYYFGFKLPT